MTDEQLRKFVEVARERVIGQPCAIEKIKDALVDAGTLSRSARPFATFLFVGGIGAGRSTMAKMMADVFFGTREAYKPILVFDSAESQIINTLSERPCIGLLRYTGDISNERERAGLASVLQRFKDNQPFVRNGEPIELKNSIFIVGLSAKLPLELTSAENEDTEESLLLWLQQHFKDKFTEAFFQSFDAIIPFKHFDVAAKTRLAETKIKELVTRQATSGRTLLVDNSVAAYVGSRAKDEFGALDVQRALDQYVNTPFSEAVAQHEARGAHPKTIRIHVVEDGIRISIE